MKYNYLLFESIERQYLVFNWDKIKSTKRIFITGYSGSGKSTLASKFARKYNLPVYCTDYFYNHLSDNKIKKKIEESEKNNDEKTINDLYGDHLHKLFEHNKKGIFEGVHIMNYVGYTENYPTLIIQYPILASTFKAYKRDNLSIKQLMYRISDNMRGRNFLKKFIDAKKKMTDNFQVLNEI